MSLSLRQRLELARITKSEPKRLLDGAVYHSAATHGDVTRFRERQIERGMKPREREKLFDGNTF